MMLIFGLALGKQAAAGMVDVMKAMMMTDSSVAFRV